MNSREKDSLLIYEVDEGVINIGDYIQSLSAKQFLTEPLQFLSREKLHEYQGNKTRLIMNGWFLHDAKNWPPAESIEPLFVAFHINSSATQLLKVDQSVEYFQTHQPIGCRDYYTVNLLKQNGIEAYFTGCLTLTLGETYYSKQKDNKIYFVDPLLPKTEKAKYKKITFLVSSLRHLFTVVKITRKKYKGKLTLKNYYNTAIFYKMYKPFFSNSIFVDAEYVTHIYKPQNFSNENQIFEEAEKLIKKYAKAKLVVTSRIHCALPCLATQTPVIYIDDVEKSEISSCRLDGLLELFNLLFIRNNKIVGSDIRDEINFVEAKTRIENKNIYKKLKEDLLRTLNENLYFLTFDNKKQ